MAETGFRFYQYNNGKTTPGTDTATLAKVQSNNAAQPDLAKASANLQSTDIKKDSNVAAGVKTNSVPATGANNGVPIKVDLDRIISGSKAEEPQDVATTVNETSPQGVAVDVRTKGTPSLFNDYWLVHYNSLIGKATSVNTLGANSLPYVGLASIEAYKNPTTSRIIEVFNGAGGAETNSGTFFTIPEKKYTYSDFLYLKHYHPYNNNRLITLRRFFSPVYDSGHMSTDSSTKETAGIRFPVAKALSYLGTSGNNFSGLSNFTVSINNKMVTGNQSDKPTMVDSSEFAKLDVFNKDQNAPDANSFGYGLLVALSGDDDATIKKWASEMDPWTNGTYADLVHGPVNVITGARIRERGLAYTHAINVNFEYSTKYIEGINPKAAMLDIISNMLSMTYHHANFFGGENRFQFNKTNYAFLNNEKGLEFINKLASGGKAGAAAALKEYAESMAKAGSGVLEGIKKIAEGLTGKGLDDPAVTQLFERAASVGATMKPKLQALNKTITQGTKATLNGSPTGEWHLQLGNPFAPMMMIGNLWCTSATFNFNDDLSADDFPTELKVAVKLEYGQQRDSSAIQSMFNNGVGRIYYPYEKTDVNKSSTYYNTEYVFNDKPSENLNAFQQTTLTKSPYEKTPDLVSKKNKSKPAIEMYQSQKEAAKKE